MKDLVQLNIDWIAALKRNNAGVPVNTSALAVMKLNSLKLRGSKMESTQCRELFSNYINNMSIIMDRADIDIENMIDGLEEMEKFLSSIGL